MYNLLYTVLVPTAHAQIEIATTTVTNFFSSTVSYAINFVVEIFTEYLPLILLVGALFFVIKFVIRKFFNW